jgi:hypothetical protein
MSRVFLPRGHSLARLDWLAGAGGFELPNPKIGDAREGEPSFSPEMLRQQKPIFLAETTGLPRSPLRHHAMSRVEGAPSARQLAPPSGHWLTRLTEAAPGLD